MPIHTFNEDAQILADPMGKTKIVWNGTDGYVEAVDAVLLGYNFDGDNLYNGPDEFAALDVVEIDADRLSKDEDGEPCFDGILGSQSGKFYKLIIEEESR